MPESRRSLSVYSIEDRLPRLRGFGMLGEQAQGLVTQDLSEDAAGEEPSCHA